jgi:hypothetical protein
MIPRTSSPPTTRPKETHQTGIPVRGALAGETVTFKSDFFDFQNIKVTPEPIQKPHPPIWLGGFTPAPRSQPEDIHSSPTGVIRRRAHVPRLAGGS